MDKQSIIKVLEANIPYPKCIYKKMKLQDQFEKIADDVIKLEIMKDITVNG